MKLTTYNEIGYCIAAESNFDTTALNASEVVLTETSESGEYHACNVIFFDADFDTHARHKMASMAVKTGNKVILNNWFRFTSTEFAMLSSLAKESGTLLLFGFNGLEAAYIEANKSFGEQPKLINVRLETPTQKPTDLLQAMFQTLLFARALSKVEFRKITGKVLSSGNMPFLFKVETENLNGELGSFIVESAMVFKPTVVLRGASQSLTLTDLGSNSLHFNQNNLHEKPYFTTPSAVGIILKKLEEIWISAGMRLI